MDDFSPEFIERYQKMYEQDPNSKVFAPLAEAYRKMGMLQEAVELAAEGVKKHPGFAGGRVALGQVLLEMGQAEKANPEFKKAVELAPENWKAHQLLADSFLHLQQPKKALHAYKRLLFINPKNEKAIRVVKKLESLTADEFSEEAFAMKPLHQVSKEWENLQLADAAETDPEVDKAKRLEFNLERFTSLSDAFIVRNDMDRAFEALLEGEKRLGQHPEIIKRMKLIQQRKSGSSSEAPAQDSADDTPAQPQQSPPPVSREVMMIDDKIQVLERLLDRFNQSDIG